MAGLIWHPNFQSIQHGHVIRGTGFAYYPVVSGNRIILPPSEPEPGSFPIKFTHSTNGLIEPEDGAMEYLNNHLYFTIGNQRIQIDQLGNGASLVYSNPIPTQTQIGGIGIGETFENISIQDMFTKLLYPYMYPAFNSFIINGQNTNIEVGETVSASKQFVWTTSYSDNISTSTIELRDITSGSIIASGITNIGSYLVTTTNITRLTASSYTWRITGQNTRSTFFTRDFTVNWKWRIYYGESLDEVLTETTIKSLRVNNLAAGFSGNFGMLTGGYKYIVIPTAFGLPTQFKDATSGFNVAMEQPYEIGITNINGVTAPYRVFRTTNILGSAITIIVS